MNKLIGIFPIVDSDEDEYVRYQKGMEIIKNGRFTSDDKWAVTAGWTIGAGVAHYDDVTNNAFLRQSNANHYWPIKPLTNYSLSFDIISAGNLDMTVFNYDSSQQYIAAAGYANGNHILLFATPLAVLPGGINFMAHTAGNAADIDNISLKEV
jgi:hypothetical protein